MFSLYFAVFGLFGLVGMVVSGVLGDRLGVRVIDIDALMYLLAGTIVFVAIRRFAENIHA